jgi:hypothetical protein
LVKGLKNKELCCKWSLVKQFLVEFGMPVIRAKANNLTAVVTAEYRDPSLAFRMTGTAVIPDPGRSRRVYKGSCDSNDDSTALKLFTAFLKSTAVVLSESEESYSGAYCIALRSFTGVLDDSRAYRGGRKL